MAILHPTAIAALTPAERLDLIAALWDSLAEGEPPLTAAQRAELDTRLAALEAGGDALTAWEDARAEIAGRAQR